jgi:CHAT domain-containing protein/tetratricopeptide (TPR) repeat protein
MTRERYEHALSVYEEVYGPEEPELGLLLSNMGSFYIEIGNYERGARLLERSVDSLQRRLGYDHPDLAPALSNLASAYRRTGRDQEAAALLERCIYLRESVLGSTHEQLAMPLRQLAYIKAELGLLNDAVVILRRVIDIEEAWVTRVVSQGSEKQKTYWSNVQDGRCNATLAFHAQYGVGDPNATALALTTLLRAKVRICDALASSILHLRQLNDVESLWLCEQWSALLMAEADWYAAILSEGETGLPFKVRRDPEFDRIRVAREDVERAIALKTSGVSLSAPRAADVDTVQQRIAPDTALIEFYRLIPVDLRRLENRNGAARYVAFVLRSSGSPLWADLGPANTIDNGISNLRHASLTSEARWRAAARELDQLLMDPVRPLLGGASDLLIVPDGEIFRVPFAALVDPSGAYEVLNYTHTYLTSGRDLLRPSVTRADSSPPLILAGPDFNVLESSSRVKRRGAVQSFEPLDHVLPEGELVHSLFRQSELRTGRNASKQCIKDARGPSILHIASHGFWHPDVRDELDVDIDSFSGAALPSPLIRSGIALAGANQYQGGLLTALEVSALDLRGTELVTLSACETGLGDLSVADGVYGLRRAVMLAGAESLLVSLFPVPDEPTCRLMEGYYRRLVALRGRAEALREVQIEMLNGGAEHPTDWAAFILVGRSEPLRRTSVTDARTQVPQRPYRPSRGVS